MKFLVGGIISLLLGISVGFGLPAPTGGDVLSVSSVGAQVTYAGDENNLTVTQPEAGVYEIIAKAFACSVGQAGCEPEKYTLTFPEKIDHIFGLGMQPAVNQVEVEDFLDTSFGFGHCYAKRKDGITLDSWEEGACRLRTPILVLPSEKIIIAYLQPDVKILQLSRNGQYGCPLGNTCIVMKKHHLYPEGEPKPFVVIKQNSLPESYAAFYRYLKSKGQFFKNPHYQAFGVNWETYGEYLCTATKDKVLDAVSRYENAGIKLSSVTIGSGYWEYQGDASGIGCGGQTSINSNLPLTDTLKVSNGSYGGLSGINNLFSILIAKGIYPLLGMRHRIQPGTPTFENINRIQNLFSAKNYDVTNKSYLIATDPSNITTKIPLLIRTAYSANGLTYYLSHYLLNTYDTNNTDTWIDLIRESYGNFKGIKHDDMSISDQRGFYNYLKGTTPNIANPASSANIRDDYSTKIFPQYVSRFNQDILIFTNNDWFSQGSDGEEIDWLAEPRMPPPATYTGYPNKFYLDTSLGRVMSGYTLPMNHVHSGFANVFGTQQGITDPALTTRFVRTTQLVTFYPVATYSVGFWHLKNPDRSDDLERQGVAKWYMQLRERLHQYAYDQAQKWYQDGVPYLMRPLVIDYPNDPDVAKLYSYLSETNDAQTPKDEYMFGNALLVRPVFSDANSIKVYFPPGNWKPFISQPSTIGRTYTQGYSDYPLPQLKTANRLDYPVFLKEGEILPITDPSNATKLQAYVFLENLNQSSVYTLYPKSGEAIKLQAEKIGGSVTIKNLTTGQSILMTNDPYGKQFRVADISVFLSPDSSPSATATPVPSPILTTTPTSILTPTSTPTNAPTNTPTHTPTSTPSNSCNVINRCSSVYSGQWVSYIPTNPMTCTTVPTGGDCSGSFTGGCAVGTTSCVCRQPKSCCTTSLGAQGLGC